MSTTKTTTNASPATTGQLPAAFRYSDKLLITQSEGDRHFVAEEGRWMTEAEIDTLLAEDITNADLISGLVEYARLFSASMSHGNAVTLAVNQGIDFGYVPKADKYRLIDLVAAQLRNIEINGK